MSTYLLERRERASQLWSEWTERARDLIERLPDITDPQNQWIKVRMGIMLKDHQLLYGRISPVKDRVDLDKLGVAVFMVLRNDALQESLPDDETTYSINENDVYFFRTKLARLGIIQPFDFILFTRSYGLTGEDSNLSQICEEYGVANEVRRKAVKVARSVILNHQVVRHIWSAR